ncbi:MAG TPA: hypothetical protein VJG48_00225 [Candidatus Paceibacterota bacterium]
MSIINNMNPEFLSKLTQAAREVKLDPSEKARIGAKLTEFVKANPVPATVAPASAKPFSGSQFFGQHFGMLAVASFLIVVGAGIVSINNANPNILSPGDSTGMEVKLPAGSSTGPDSVAPASSKVAPPVGGQNELIYPPVWITGTQTATSTQVEDATTTPDNSKVTTASTTPTVPTTTRSRLQ